MKGKAEDIGMKRLCSILLALLLLFGACSGEESKNGLPQGIFLSAFLELLQ